MDVGLTCEISRGLLGLPDLDLNDHVDYFIGGESFSDFSQSWTRTQVRSRWVDGAITTSRTRDLIQVPLVVEVLAGSLADVKAKTDALIEAFEQDSFTLGWAVGGEAHQYQGEAADWSKVITTARLAAHQGAVKFSIPCQPLDLLDGA